MWENIVDALENPEHEVDIAMVGKYVDLQDSYKSLSEALIHAGIHTRTKVKIHYVDSEQIEAKGVETLKDMDAILVPGGFGKRGIEGKIAAVKYARENKVPYLGICLGMQIAAIEIARNKCGPRGRQLDRVRSRHAAPGDRAHHRVAEPRRQGRAARRASRTSAARCAWARSPRTVKKGTLAHKIYGKDTVAERHRHRYEVNNHYVPRLEAAAYGRFANRSFHQASVTGAKGRPFKSGSFAIVASWERMIRVVHSG